MDIHDHHIVELRVNAPERTLTVTTTFGDGNAEQRAQVRFSGVAAYVLQGDVLGTILFDVVEVDPLTLYQRHSTWMQRVCTENGGHAGWCSSEASTVAFLSDGRVRGYEITSSIGMNGAVWAEAISIESRA